MANKINNIYLESRYLEHLSHHWCQGRIKVITLQRHLQRKYGVTKSDTGVVCRTEVYLKE